ncbi:nudix-type nucleoside diphosphatase (YffH/AdpP family) [Novosphingobium chloroacetimidivorans]|uniref:Nudix-type nucleoside diphosphatase (YffH/AdpP family) n=1 Tax=Novosphingobium chloroacetimidivorans TaxID=1428314 RepID=A0A7W7NXN6_9SPHN|nr:ADP-ribose pyrophosphatase [Novosphingobium chloroacetimidivorans]MBB4859385.1 nudix-type nucleoside diphosphatase (YffH/AdpP family) [Novosphingobium chloroacetimidivorans]
MNSTGSTAKIVSREVVFQGWYTFFRLLVEMPDGQVVDRELLHRGMACAVLPYDPVRRVAMLITQPRPGALHLGVPSPYEVIAGSLDGASPAERIVEEAMEEGGLRLGRVEPITNMWSMIPVSTERVQLYLAEYGAADRVAAGGGNANEHENIVVHELGLDELRDLTMSGELSDAKTLILAQALMLRHPELWRA